MRAFKIAMALALLAICINVVPAQLFPAYNGGTGLDRGVWGDALDTVNTWTVDQMAANWGGWVPTGVLGAILDYALMSLKMMISALIIFAMIFFSSIIIYPALVGIFDIDPTLSLVFQVGLFAIYGVGILQFMSGRGFKLFE